MTKILPTRVDRGWQLEYWCYTVSIVKQKEGVMGISRDKAIELVEEGIVDPIQMVIMCVKYMSEDDVEDMLDCNELSDRFMEEDDGQPTWEQEWADFGEEY